MNGDDGIDLVCPHCGQPLRVPTYTGGTEIACPDCNGMIEVPAKTAIAEGPGAPWSWPTPSDSDDDDGPRRRRRDRDDDYADVSRRRHGSGPAATVMAPAICMLVVAVFGICMALFNTAYALMPDPPPVDPNAPPILQEFMRNTHGPTTAFVQGACAMASALTIFGSVQMLRQKHWGFAVAASVFSMVNFGSCCCLFGLPFGIWALTTLANPEVKDGFT